MENLEYPVIEALETLTDETGMLQHAKFSIIDRRKGYTTDDNARALIVALRHYGLHGDTNALDLANLYLTFLLHMQRDDGRLHNILGFDRVFKDEVGSEDSMGRAIWATGYSMASDAPEQTRMVAKEIFDKALPPARGFNSPRAIAFTLMGLTEYYKARGDDTNILHDVGFLADRLVRQYELESEEGWRWFELYLTYANARIPEALFNAYNATRRERYLKTARISLDFLIEVCFIDSVFHPIGSEGWYERGGKRAMYDQQPLEANCMVGASLEAMKITGNSKYYKTALRSFEWYLGENVCDVPLIDPDNHLCYDGITEEGLNRNQGAESTLSYMLSYLSLKEHKVI
ncbi:MAG: glycosyltransferase [Candidatus Bathyarchaeia archaeon]